MVLKAEKRDDFGRDQIRKCQRIFDEWGMETIADWLEDYNNLDVGPFLESLKTMRDFYIGLGIDNFKEAVSLPGVAHQYLLRGTFVKPNAPELFAPGEEAYGMLKGTVVGWPTLVFTRKHEAGKTLIRPHKYPNPRVCQRMLGYGANSFYPSRMLNF